MMLKTAVEMGTDSPESVIFPLLFTLESQGFPHPFTIDNLIEWLHPKHYLDVKFSGAVSSAEDQELENLVRMGIQSLKIYGALLCSIMDSRCLTVAKKASVIRMLDEPNCISVKYGKINQWESLTRFQAFWAIGGDGGPAESEYLSNWTRIGEWSGFIPAIPSREVHSWSVSAFVGLQSAIDEGYVSLLDFISMVNALNRLLASVPDAPVRITKNFSDKATTLQQVDDKGNWHDVLSISYASL
jgi:hypothetical protein